jgi:nitrate reductase NapAB chaperone NapD
MRGNGQRQLDADRLSEHLRGSCPRTISRISISSRNEVSHVDLGELGLAVGAQVLVAEALGDLVVAVEARHHQQLLEELRRLRQREELPGVHAATAPG